MKGHKARRKILLDSSTSANPIALESTGYYGAVQLQCGTRQSLRNRIVFIVQSCNRAVMEQRSVHSMETVTVLHKPSSAIIG